MLKAAMRLGITEYLCLPLRAEDINRAVKNSLEIWPACASEAVLLESRRATAGLQRRLDELETLTRLGRTVTGSLDLDHVLTAIVEAAVELTGAEEGSLLLLDEETGELYMRAARNFQEEFVRTFRIPVKTPWPARSSATGSRCCWMTTRRRRSRPLTWCRACCTSRWRSTGTSLACWAWITARTACPSPSTTSKLLDALAEFAVIAIENSRLYTETITERHKMETVLTDVRDGVILIDQDQRLVLVNQVVREALGLGRRAT